MQIGTKLFVLLCLFLGQCIAAPPRQDGTKTRGWSYTVEEDKFIVEEMTKLADENPKVFCRGLWTKIAEKHHKKWQQRTPGFPQERSVKSLFGRFKDTLVYNRPDVHVKLPESLLQKLPTTRNQKKPRGSRATPYNAEETKLTYQELLKPSCRTFHGSSTWETIRAEHDRRRLVDNDPAFRHERTAEGLRHHTLRHKDQLPEEIAKKFGIQQKGASSSNPPNQQTDLQVTDEGQSGGDELIADMIEERVNTNYEIDFSKLEPDDNM